MVITHLNKQCKWDFLKQMRFSQLTGSIYLKDKKKTNFWTEIGKNYVLWFSHFYFKCGLKLDYLRSKTKIWHKWMPAHTLSGFFFNLIISICSGVMLSSFVSFENKHTVPFRAAALLPIHYITWSLQTGHRVPLTMCDPCMTS